LQDSSQRQRTHRTADLNGLLVIRLRFVVVLAVVEAEVKIAVVAGKIVVTAEAGIGRAQEAFALREDRSLEAVAIDAFRVIDIRRLLHAEAEPRSVRRPVIEVELPVGVLEAVQLAAGE